MKYIVLILLLCLPGLAHAQSCKASTPNNCPFPIYSALGIGGAPPSVKGSVSVSGGINSQGVSDVILSGADPTGTVDSAAAIQAAATAVAASGGILRIPPGTYLFSTHTAAPSPYTAFQPAGVVITGACGSRHWEIDGDGATIIIGTNQPTAAAFFIDRSCNWSMKGLTIQGNRMGLTTQANPAIELASDVNFQVTDMHMTGNFGFSGQAVAADWLVNGLLKDWTVDSAGFCADTAYLLNVTFQNWTATGTDNTGLTTAAHPGTVCMSVIVDPPNASFNFTGVPFTETSRVTYKGIDAQNFATGSVIKTGTYYTYTGNRWHDLPGNASNSTVGVGVEIAYDSTLSVGVPASFITINGDTFSNNSAAVSGGAGVYIGNSQITNSDKINGILITGCVFDNNSGLGIIMTGTVATTVANVFVRNNSFSGTSQVSPFNLALEQLGTVVESPSTGITFANGFNLNNRDTANNVYNWIFTSGTNTVIRPVGTTAGTGVAIQNTAGTSIAVFNATGSMQTTFIGPIATARYTVATLPTCNATNSVAALVTVTDQNGTPTFGGALTGGGTTVWPAYCNGAAWSAH